MLDVAGALHHGRTHQPGLPVAPTPKGRSMLDGLLPANRNLSLPHCYSRAAHLPPMPAHPLCPVPLSSVYCRHLACVMRMTGVLCVQHLPWPRDAVGAHVCTWQRPLRHQPGA